MAKLGNVFLNTVFEDKPDMGVKITDHPIEGGLGITDHVQQEPLKMSISGVVTGADASARRSQLISYMKNGNLLKYVYRTVLTNMVIENFSSVHDVDVKGGFKFNIALKQVIIANKAESNKKKKTVTSGGRKQPAKPATLPKGIYTVKKGDTLGEIAQRAKMTTQALYNKNKKVIGPNPNKLFVGQKLVI
jgi:hypothetical protein